MSEEEEDMVYDVAHVFHLAALQLHDLSKRTDQLPVEMQITVGGWMCEYERTAAHVFAGYPRILAALKETLEHGTFK
jgi:hypothetical protein